MKREGGVHVLEEQEREAATQLLSQLEQYGVMIVSGGELESWLKPLGATGHGPSWLVDVFTRMGSDPSTTGYVLPSIDDVWRFLSQVKAWLTNPNRHGIPS